MLDSNDKPTCQHGVLTWEFCVDCEPHEPECPCHGTRCDAGSECFSCMCESIVRRSAVCP